MYTCEDIKPDAVKIGMLHSSRVILSVIKALKKIKTKKIVLDPVMIAKGGAQLINKSATKNLKNVKFGIKYHLRLQELASDWNKLVKNNETNI